MAHCGDLGSHIAVFQISFGFLFSDLVHHYVFDPGYQLAETAKAKVQDHYPRGCFRNLRVA